MEENNKIPPQIEDLLNEIDDYVNETGNYINASPLGIKHLNDISTLLYENTLNRIGKIKLQNIQDVENHLVTVCDKMTLSILNKHVNFLDELMNSYKTGKEKNFNVIDSSMKMYVLSTSLIIMRLEPLRLSEEIRKELTSLKELYSNTSNKKGCYIATMVYGSYEAPQVLILREFRDNVLDKSALGRLFIRFYYKISPGIVNMLKNHSKVNLLIKSILDSIIKLLKHD
ncbi:MAG TPA: hypothetical protein PKZ44_00165 [Flavobacterium sp.]|nr:hypothetical protein [Flavobacterium sp.]